MMCKDDRRDSDRGREVGCEITSGQLGRDQEFKFKRAWQTSYLDKVDDVVRLGDECGDRRRDPEVWQS